MSRLSPLQRWNATAFLVAGAFLIAFVARNAVIAFGSGFSETMAAGLYLAFVVPAELAAYIGLLGLYPRLADQVPRLAGAGAALAGIAGVSMLGFGLTAGSTLLRSGTADPPAVTQVLWLVALVTTVLGFAVFGGACLRARVPSRRFGLLLLGPPAVYVVMLAGGVVGYTPEWSTFVISGLQAGAHIAVGLALRSGSAPSGRDEPTADSAA